MDGRLKEGFDSFSGSHRPHQSQVKLQTNLGQHVHSVILCVSVDSVIQKDQDEFREINALLQKIHQDFDISPIVLITKIDKIFKEHVFESS